MGRIAARAENLKPNEMGKGYLQNMFNRYMKHEKEGVV
jgi:hypothetical protein